MSARILVVDDTPEVLDFVEACLVRERYEVRRAESQAEARAAIAGEVFDAVVTDVELPDGNGMELIALLGTAPPRTRVVVVTAHADTDRAIQALHAGAYDFIRKPIEVGLLRSAVRRAIEARCLEREIDDHRRFLEERVSEGTAQRSEANRRLEESRDQMIRAEKMATIGCIAAGVAHEINNPIGFINSNLATLKGYVGELRPLIEALKACAPPDAPVQQRMEKMDLSFVLDDIDQLVRESEDGVKRVVKIVRDLKTFSHVSTGAPEPADLNECASVAANLCRSETKHVAEVSLELAELPRIVARPDEITQVLVNLIANAAQAIAADERTGRITVRSRLEGASVVLEVEDDGPGIPAEIVDRIFDPFFTTKPAGKGTGLGLSLSTEIVGRHRGEIRVEPAERGARFVVRLPLAAEAVSHAGIPENGNDPKAA